MIGVNIGRAGTKMTRCDKNREGSLWKMCCDKFSGGLL